MSVEPISKSQKLSKSIEMMLKTVLAGAGYASKQLEVLLGRRLLDRGMQGVDRSPNGLTAPPREIVQNSTALTLLGESDPRPHSQQPGCSEPTGSLANCPSVLIVEPHSTIRTVMRLTLQREGYQVFEADTGSAALNLLARGLPHLVLQNLVLPDMDGFGLIQWLNTLPGGKAVPILAMADDSSLLAQARSKRVGFSSFLTRPILPSYLLQTTFAFVPVQRQTKELPMHLWRNGGSSQRESPVDHGRLSRLGGGPVMVVESNDFQSREIVSHLSKLGLEVATAGDAQAALDQSRAFPPDLIICDPLIPNLDGFCMCLEMKKDVNLAAIPVVLTPLATPIAVDAELAHEVGAAGYESRTPDFAALDRIIRNILRKSVSDLGISSPNLLQMRTT